MDYKAMSDAELKEELDRQWSHGTLELYKAAKREAKCRGWSVFSGKVASEKPEVG